MKAQTNNADRSEKRNPGGPKATPQEDFELTPGQLLGIVGGDARTDPGDDDDKMSGGELAALILAPEPWPAFSTALRLRVLQVPQP